jgi:hypothetical protein
MLSMIRKAFVAASLLLVLTGCVSAPPLNFAVDGVQASAHKLDADLRATSVSYASPAEKTGDLPSDGEAVPQLWQSALQEGLNRATLFDDDSSNKVNLLVKIMELDVPAGGVTMTTTSMARYQLVSRKTGKVLYQKDIAAIGEVSPGYAFSGLVRIKESINRAVQNNIREFLSSMDTATLAH